MQKELAGRVNARGGGGELNLPPGHAGTGSNSSLAASEVRRLERINKRYEAARRPVLKVGSDGTLLQANRAGLELAEAFGSGLGRPLPAEMHGLFRTVITSGHAEDIEVRLPGRRLMMTVAPRPAAPPGPDGGKGAEEERAPSAAIESIPAFFYLARADGEGQVGWASPGALSITGFPPGRFVTEARLWQDRIHPEDRERVLGEWEGLRTTGRFSSEYRWLRSDGHYRWLLDRAVRLESSPGQVAGTRMDVTLRHEAEEWMKQKCDFMETLLDSVESVIAIIDSSGRVHYLNSPFERLLGIGRESWIRGDFRFRFHDADRETGERTAAAAVSGECARCTVRLRAQDGRQVRVSLMMSPFRWKGRPLALGIGDLAGDREVVPRAPVPQRALQAARPGRGP